MKRQKKSVEQIRSEWEAIEAECPGGSLPNIIKTLSSVKAQEATGDKALLFSIISTLHEIIQSYHVEMGILLGAYAEALEQIDHMRNLKTEYDPADWSGPTGYRQFATDVLPYMYSWKMLDQLMSHFPERARELVDYLKDGSIAPEFLISEQTRTIALYREMIRTLADPQAPASAEGGAE